MFGFIKKVFITLLASIVNASNRTKCISLSNQPCMIQPTIINLHPNKCTQRSCYYLFAVNLNRCNTFNDLSDKVCIPDKTKDLNLSLFNIITEINESKTLAKHISCK